MSNHPLQQQQQPSMIHSVSRSNSQSSIQHAIKRNIGSSTTSLTAFAISQPDKVPVSLSPFEYLSPLTSQPTSYFGGHVKGVDERSARGSLANMDSEDLDFDTAYNMMNQSIDSFAAESQHQQQLSSQQPRTPELQMSALQYRSPNTLAQLRFYQENDPVLQDHRRAIIQAGLPNHTQSGQQQFAMPHQLPSQHPSPFQVSPHTRNLLYSVNNLTQANNTVEGGYELLSITESSALEKFLDSVVDDSKLNDLGKYWPSIDPLAKNGQEYNLPGLMTEGTKTSSNLGNIPDLKLQKINTDIKPMHPIPHSHALSLMYDELVSGSPSNANFSSESTLTPQSGEPVKKKRGRKKKILTPEEELNKLKKPKLESTPGSESARLKRLMLTEEQKKLHHTESEKKRRAMIKSAYDNLLDTIKSDKCYHIKYSNETELQKKKNSKRGNSRHAVMNCVISEIEWLLQRNEELKLKLGEQ